MSERILVVDDENVLRNNLVRYLNRMGHDATGATSAEAALEAVADDDYAIVLTDLKMPGMGGQELLARLRVERPETLVLVMTAYASVDSAIGALRDGAQDYLLKPLSLDEVGQKIMRILDYRAVRQENKRLKQVVHQRFEVDTMVAEAPAMKRVMKIVGKAASSRSSVLIEGESGTGKELIARALHERSAWSDKPFIAVNLAAQPRELVDATLFGHERGAFTGATARRDGVFRAARGGTVFLDELAELPTEVQVKLLRVLENREVLPLGADRPVSVDFRLVTATNRSLERQVEAGAFRHDLLYRVDVVRIELPPLRNRREDIAPLVQRFLNTHSAAIGSKPPQVPNSVMRLLESYSWPGNIRELSNALERAVLLSDGPWIQPEYLPLRSHPTAVGDELKSVLEDCERRHIRRVLSACDGDKNMAAERLGVHLATLYRRLERMESDDG